MILVLFALNCPQTIMINRTKERWSEWDRSRMNYCQKRCSKEYDDAPCLKRFYKTSHQVYFCLCGKGKK